MITHVSVKGFKSLASVEVELGPLTILVGQNSTGKSNFIDALRFVSDALSYNLERAVADRGGMGAILRPPQAQEGDTILQLQDTPRPGRRGRRPDLSIGLKFIMDGQSGEFTFKLAGRAHGEIEVKQERCVLAGQGYEVQRGKLRFIPSEQAGEDIKVDTSILVLGAIIPNVEGSPQKAIREYLYTAGHYSIFPDNLRNPRRPGFPYQLWEDANNLHSVLHNMRKASPSQFSRLKQVLTSAVPDISDIMFRSEGGFLFVRLKHGHDGQSDTFDLSQESDGTIRLLGILTALHQDPPPPLITLEEPELNIHPGALKILYDTIKEASQRSQIIISTHSPDLVSFSDPNDLRVVEKVGGETKIGFMNDRQIQIINDRLFSTGDLLRIEGLQRQGHDQTA